MLPLGIYSWFGFKLPLEKRLKMIADAGFKATCLWFGHEEEMVQGGRAGQLPELVRNSGLVLDNIHASFWHSNYIWVESKSEQSVSRQELSNTLEFCGKYQIPIMVMHLSAGHSPPPPNRNGLELIRELVRRAEDLGVIIALENTEDYGNRYLDFVFSNIRSPNLGFCYDSSHDYIARESRGEALQKWGSYLVTTHLSDNQGINDDHLLPGYGKIDWKKVMKHFPKSTFKGILLLEVDGPEAGKGFTAEEFLKTGYQKAQRLAQMLEK